MIREVRFIALKISDIERYCSGAEVEALQDILKTISEGRASDGKALLQCVCVESDWPEYETVWQMIEAREEGKELPPTTTEDTFPMQNGPAIPVSLAKVIYAGYSAINGTSQSLRELGDRGGFSWGEVEFMYKKRQGKAAMDKAQHANQTGK